MADVEAQIHGVPKHQPALTSMTANPQRPQPPHSAASPLAATDANPLATYYPTHPRPPNSAFSRPQATGTNGRPNGNVSLSRIAGNQGMLIFFTFHKAVFSFACQARNTGTLLMRCGPCTSRRPRSKIRTKLRAGRGTQTGSSYL
jgi:hypothetical protein